MTKRCPFIRAIPAGAYSVVTYGAVGDGETDDREAFQDCIDEATAAGQWAYIPPAAVDYHLGTLGTGNNAYSLSIPSNAKIIGAGAMSLLESSALYPMRIVGKTNVLLKNFALDGGQAIESQAGVAMLNDGATPCSYITMEDLTINNMHFAGSRASSAQYCYPSYITWKGCTCYNCGMWGLQIDGPDFDWPRSTNITIEDCTINHCGHLYGTGIYTWAPHGIYLKWVDGFTISGSTIYDTKEIGPQNAMAIALTECNNGAVTQCDVDIADIAIQVSYYGGGGCQNIATSYCTATNIVKNWPFFDYGSNYNTGITWANLTPAEPDSVYLAVLP